MTKTQTDTNVKQAVPLFSVSNIRAVGPLHVDGLGFSMTNQWNDGGRLRWCWLQRGGAALMLKEFPQTGHDSWMPSGKVGEGVAIYFVCEDAPAIFREVTAHGIPGIKTLRRKRDVGDIPVRS